MKLARTLLLAALLTTAACQPSNPPAAPASSPPLADLTCPAEPDIAAAMVTDPSGLGFDISVREAGEACRLALSRVCSWHRDRGTKVVCDKP